MVRFRWPVLAAWVVVIAVLGGAFGQRATTVLKGGGFDTPGSGSYQATKILDQDFHQSTANNVVVVFHSATKTVDDPDFSTQVATGVTDMQKVKSVGRVLTFFNTLNPNFVSTDRHTTIAIVALTGKPGQVDDLVPQVRDQLKPLTIEHYVTGLPAINKDTFLTSDEDLHRAEAFTFPIVLILLLLVFRTLVSALIPLVLGVAAIVVTTAQIFLIGNITDTSIFAVNVSSLIGLGLGIDYSLILINRYREEVQAGRARAEAIPAAVATAGRSVVYSGVTVVLAMLVLTLVLFDLMIVRSVSLAVLLVALNALLAAVTLVPALLAVLGSKLEWVRVLPRPKSDPTAKGFWYRWSHTVMRRPVAWLLLSLVLLGILASPIRDMAMVGAATTVLPPSRESVQGANLMNQAFGANRLTPIQIVIRAKQTNGVWDPKFLDTLDRVTKAVQADPRTESASSLSTYMAAEPHDVYLGLKPDFFTPAPPLPSNPSVEPTLDGLTTEPIVDATIDAMPPPAAFVGLARFTLAPGTSLPKRSINGSDVIRVESGSLGVLADGALKVNKGSPSAAPQQMPAGSQFAAGAGDQVIVPPRTSVAFSNPGGSSTSILVATAFTIETTPATATSWTDGFPSSDLFAGLPRQVLSGGATYTLPSGPIHLVIDRATLQPGVLVPKHIHPGPEQIAVVSGEFTVFYSPQMTVIAPDGTVETAVFDAPLTLPAGGKALVQGYGVHRAKNLGTVPVVFYSTRFLDPAVPPIILVGSTQATDQFVNLTGRGDTAVITVVPRFNQYDSRHQAFVYDLRQRVLPNVPGIGAYTTYVGGDAAYFVDFRDSLYGRFPLIVVLITLMIFVILLMFFQSIVLPIKAMAMNLATIVATYGVLVAIFQWGWGTSLLGFKSQGLVNVITPAILFVVLFALSTDYEVFMLSRVKEYYRRTGNNEEAVAAGLQRTGGVITAAGLILVGTFGSFAAANIVTLKEIGLGLAIGVLLDSTVVRIVMVPATMRLMGRANWWMPAGLKRFVPELSEGEDVEPVAAAAGAAVTASHEMGADHATVAGNGWRARLVPLPGTPGGPVALPANGEVTIGRSQESQLRLDDVGISRHHAVITCKDGLCSVRDLASRNGVSVNGQALAPSTDVVLKPGDEVGFGSVAVSHFRYAYEAVPSREELAVTRS